MKKAAEHANLSQDKLAWKVDMTTFPFESSDDCEPCEDIIGQDRALKSLKTGLDIRSLGYNIFITGLSGTGRTTTVKKLLEKMKDRHITPEDMVYVNNFEKPDEPVLIKLKTGQGKDFKQSMDKLIRQLKTNIPELLKSKYYQERRDSIIEGSKKQQRDILKKFEEEVSKEGFSVIQVQMGMFTKPDLIPVIEGKPTPFSKLESMVREDKFSKEKLDALKEKYSELTDRLEEIFEKLKEIEEETRKELQKWDEESITPIIKGLVNDIRRKFENEKIQKFLENVERDLIQNIDIFENEQKEKREMPGDPFFSYRVNLLIDNSETKGAPVVMENNPNYINLFGSIEMTPTKMGTMRTDFTRIKAGSFLKANGGYLVLNALDALTEPGVWPTLKRTLKYQTLEIQNYAALFLFSTTRLKPEKIDCDVNVVMIGDSRIYYILYFLDPDFQKIFKVKSEFDSETQKNEDVLKKYVGFIKKIVDEENLTAFDKSAIAALVEYATRLAGRQRKITTRFHILADLIRESNYLASEENQDKVTRVHVEQAIKDRFERVSLIEDKIAEMIDEGTILIDTEGKAVGQVNGLSVYPLAEEAGFGKPTRITASTSVGRAGVINIEREANLSGRTHNKGVLILSGYLRGKYCQNRPFSLSASIAFEQSYSGVEGDSASSTEIYAILSSLSQLPLRQDIAVTGSVNQKGEIQAIGGVNEKIEGFFDVCRKKGMNNSQGVIIPAQNVQNLMLKPEVIEACREGRFFIYPIKTVDEGMEILTGFKAGDLKEDGTFEEDTINYKVDQELQRLAESWKSYSKSIAKKEEE
ncbi:MAG: ATP-binding protein [Candidatus Aminicenantes bacterium]